MILENLQKKKIQQIQIKFSRDRPPYKYWNPYCLMKELNRAVKNIYDIEFIHVKYLQTKNREQRNMDNQLTIDSISEINKEVNNIFSKQFGDEANQFLSEFLFSSAERLRPPHEFNIEESQKNLQKEKTEEEMAKLLEIKDKIAFVMKVYNEKTTPEDLSRMRSIEVFLETNKHQPDSEFEIYTRAIMNQPVYEKLRVNSQEKKAGIELKFNNDKVMVYLNPTKQQESIEKIHPEYIISSWSLNCFDKQFLTTYFGTEDLQRKAQTLVNSVELISSISFNQNDHNIDSFSLTTYLWSETVMKMVVKLAQIKKIQKVHSGNKCDYYFYLNYPPMYFINELKKDEGNVPKYLKFFTRVINFVLLLNNDIKDNYFLRYYLFNNSILKITVILDNSRGYQDHYHSVYEAQVELQNLCNRFQGTIQYIDRKDQQYKQKFSLKVLAKLMSFKSFQKLTKPHLDSEIQDKLWKIRYLILVLVRHNFIIPTELEINQILNCITDDKNIPNIDCYLYVLWKVATNIFGFTDKRVSFSEYFKIESEEVKSMSGKNLKRMLEQSDSIIYIFRVSLTPSGYLFNPPSPEMKGRLMKEFNSYSQFFMRVSLCDESEVDLKNQEYITRMFFKKHMEEIIILDRIYEPLGWSPSQLRSFSLWYFHPLAGAISRKLENGTPLANLKRTHILDFLGDFTKIENPARKAARIGQSFSSSWTYKADKIQETLIDDIESSAGFCYTDGIGKISQYLLEDISTKLNMRDLSVIQIRYKGAKGVLVRDPQLKRYQVHLRPSMIKYQCKDPRAQSYLDILDWNKYKPGFLNRQVIILLRTLQIQDETFMRLQKQHITTISKMTYKDCSVFKQMNEDLQTDINNLQPANKTILNLINAGFQLDKEPFFRGVLETLKKNGYYQLKMKSNICVQKSARLIGIIDEDGVLQENEIYCSIYDHFAQNPIREVVDSQAIITRNPCLDPADIRVVRCVGRKEIAERMEKIKKDNKFDLLWNVVVMPLKGRQPLTSQISGSDLDGDNFFICWDSRLIPTKAADANTIDEPNVNKGAPKEIEAMTEKEMYKKMLDFFIDYTNYEKLGQIDNSHLVHADRDLLNFANNEKCKRLAKIHGKAVDFPKTGYCPPVDPELFCKEYPDFMEKENAQSVYRSESVLGKLYRDIKQKIQSLLEDKVYTGVTEIDKSLIYKFSFDQTKEEVQSCILVLKQYEREMTNLISLIGVDTEYEIYSGNFSSVKNKVKAFGKNRLISTIMSIRERFFEIFFKDLDEDERKYKSIKTDEKHMLEPQFFSEAAFRKAQIYYLVNYIRKFPELKDESLKSIKLMISEVLQELKMTNQEALYCGFIWFVIPKVIINIKRTCVEDGREKKSIVDEDQNYGEEDGDEGYA